MALGVQDEQVAPLPRLQAADLGARPRAAAPPTVAARSACEGVSFIPWQASAIIFCMLSQ